MKKALFAGSFNPITLGHLDLILRAARLFNPLILGIALNHEKTKGIFTEDEVQDCLKNAVKDLPNVVVIAYKGLTVDFAKSNQVDVLIRGLRSAADIEWELSLAAANRKLSGIETLIMPGDPKFSFISSTLVREIAASGGNLSEFVPPDIEKRIRGVASPQ